MSYSIRPVLFVTMVLAIMGCSGRAGQTDYDGQRALFLAVDRGDIRQVIRLVADGADLRGVDENGVSTLQYAMARGDLEMLSYLVEAMPPVEQTPVNGSEIELYRWIAHFLLDVYVDRSSLGSALEELRNGAVQSGVSENIVVYETLGPDERREIIDELAAVNQPDYSSAASRAVIGEITADVAETLRAELLTEIEEAVIARFLDVLNNAERADVRRLTDILEEMQ